MSPSRIRRVRIAALLAVTVVAMFMLAGTASAVTLTPTSCPLPGSNFQGGDGNQQNESAKCPTANDPSAPFIDWQGLAADSRTLDFNALPDGDPLHPGADSTFAGGNKETDLTNWKISSPLMQVTPNKDNLFAAWEGLAKGASGNAPQFLYLALSREVNTGDTHLEFELNQKPAADNWTNAVGQSVPCRTNGDLLISYEVASGGSPPNVDVVVYNWTSSTFAPANSGPLGSLCGATGSWVSHNPGAGNAEGAINKNDLAPNTFLTDATGNSTFDAGTFGEAALNLPGIFQAAGEGSCTNFGQFAVHSRSSTSIDSQLQDLIGPAPVLIQSCSIKTTADTNVAVGAKITDSATVNLAYQPAAISNTRVNFTAYSDSACTQSVFTDSQTPTQQQNGSLTATSAQYTTQSAGTYYWQATFVDNTNGVTVAGVCGDTTGGNQERSVVNPLQPTVTTHAFDATIASNGSATIHDSATLSGGTANAGGTLTFRVYSDSNCQNLLATASPATTVSGATGQTYQSANVTVNAAGTYYWSVQYSGDLPNNQAIGQTACGIHDQNNEERSVVSPLQPTVTTHASNASIDGNGNATIHDSATLSGGTNGAAGTLTFRVYSDSNCQNLVATASPATSVNAGASGATYQSADVTVGAAGTYYWSVQYSGDLPNNQAIAETTCGIHDQNNEERSVVSPLQPTVTTHASNASLGGDGSAKIHDSATLSDGTANAGGTLTFRVYSDSSCQTLVATAAPATSVNGADGDSYQSADVTVNAAGTYYWSVEYSGDLPNDPGIAETACGIHDQNNEERSVVSDLSITKTADAATVESGTPIGFTVTVTGAGPATGVQLNDPLPAGPAGNTLDWSIDSVSGIDPAKCTISGSVASETLHCDAVDLGTGSNSGTAQHYTVHVVSNTDPDGPGFTAHNTATASATNHDDVQATASERVIRTSLLVVKDGSPGTVHDGDSITFTYKVTNPGTDPVTVDSISDDKCSPIGAPAKSGGNQDAFLDPGETWTYTCTTTAKVADETTAADGSKVIVNVVTVTGHDDGNKPLKSTDDHTTKVVHPAIAIDKTGPANATVGDKVGYTLTVTNPGDTPLGDPTVKVSDAQCNGDPVTLLGKGGDASPATLDPGDTWTYSCSVQTAAGDTAIHNTATVTGCDSIGGCVNASDTADTVLAAQIVSPGRITPGTAKLAGPTGCVSRAFIARVRGTKIATVTFVLDGKVVKKVANTKNATVIALRIDPAKYRIGVHRLVTNITFQSGSQTKPKTLRLSFQRCAKKLIKPRFTG